MAIYAFDGLPGAGKSYAMHERAFRIAEDQEKDGIVTNQEINIEELGKWAELRKMRHLVKIAEKEHIIYDSSLQSMLSYRNAVTILDEAGIFCNSRDWADLKKQAPNFIVDLCQVRKGGVDLIWSAQSHEMVDRQLRHLTNFYYVCKSLNRLYWRHMFDAEGLERWKAGGRLLRWRVKFEFGFFDLGIFKIYDSFVRLEDKHNKGRYIPEIVAARKGEIASTLVYDVGKRPLPFKEPTTGFWMLRYDTPGAAPVRSPGSPPLEGGTGVRIGAAPGANRPAAIKPLKRKAPVDAGADSNAPKLKAREASISGSGPSR